MAFTASRAICLVAAALLGIATASEVTIMPDGGQFRESDLRTQRAEEGEQLDSAFNAFVVKHGREFEHGTDEYEMRKSLFGQRLAAARAHNARPGQLWKEAPSQHSDRTDAERASVLGYVRGLSRPARGGSLLQSSTQPVHHAKLPKSKSWKHLKVASHIRDQGMCGSCWAVATVSVMDAHYEIYSAKNGTTKSFSAQDVTDCTPNPHECGGQGGCQGATVELAMDFILKGGVATEEEVPYKGSNGACNARGDSSTGFLSTNGPSQLGLISYRSLPSNEDYALAEAVAKHGPVAVSASAAGWYEYSSGIFEGCEQNTVVDHAITLYGYGEEKGKMYWLIRNSWGGDWGEEGFIRLLRHGAEHKFCGIDNDPSEGTGCKGGPPSVQVCGMCGILFDSVVPQFKGSPDFAPETKGDASPSLMRMEAKRH